MPERRKRDWEKFWIHFVFGAVLGAFLGFIAWGESSYVSSAELTAGVVFIGGGALIVGLIAGVAAEGGDHFWHGVMKWFRSWWW